MNAKYWESIADSLSRYGCSWGMIKTTDEETGFSTWVLDARQNDGPRHIVYCDDLLAGFLELETSLKANGQQ